MATRIGDGGCLTLYGREPLVHELLAEHLTAEYYVATEAKTAGRVVNEWKVKPNRTDNHWFDCLVGCAVGASMLGVELAGTVSASGGGGRSLRLSEIQKVKHGGAPDAAIQRGGRIRLSDIQAKRRA